MGLMCLLAIHLLLCRCSLLAFIAQSAGAVEYTDCFSVRPFPNECPEYDTKQSDGEAPENEAGALGNAEYPFIVIASRSTLAGSGCT